MALQQRRKFCYFKENGITEIDYKDIKLLSRYISEKGKILPTRITNVSNKKQKLLSQAIKRARYLGLISYTQEYM